MKYLIIVLLFPFAAKAQYDNLILENGNLYFEKVYTVDSMPVQLIEKLLTSNIPVTKSVSSFIKIGDVITAKLTGSEIDIKKYGGNFWKDPAIVNHPVYGDINIIWKDNKYKVRVTNIYFLVGGTTKYPIDDLITLNNGKEFDKRKATFKIGNYLQFHLSDLFTFKMTKDNW